MLFLAGTLGLMAGVTAYLIYKAVITQNFALLAIVPAVLLTSIPMVNAVRRLRASAARGSSTPTGSRGDA
jgi:hypothetical protein